jgi:hypothetical protein
MEIVVEVPDEKAQELNLTDAKISLEELEKRLAGKRMSETMLRAHEVAKMYGIDRWTMDDVNQLIKEARAEYEKENGSD